MAKVEAIWRNVTRDPHLQRSSHSVAIVGSSVYVFGGELKPREPRDNHVHILHLPTKSHEANGSLQVQSVEGTASSPSPRVGSAATTVDGDIYFFSGRGGLEMAPIEEHGTLWRFQPSSSTWSAIQPSAKTDNYPPARSYHSMTSDGHDTIYVHAGCPGKGRLSDLWAFSLSANTWKQLASAPDPPRGGPSIAFAEGKLYRMNGFDGKTEQGGSLDIYEPRDDRWTSLTFPADGKSGPGARSVSALLPITLNGKTALVTLFGESDPSSLGHQGAGKMLTDAWVYSIEEGKWHLVEVKSRDQPDARGWFDADVLSTSGEDEVVVCGGLGESNERLNDVWVLSFSGRT